MPEAISFATVFDDLQNGSLDAASVERSFSAILDGCWNPYQIAAFLAALRVRGEDATVIGAAVRSMRALMVPVRTSGKVVLDTCGTGGDGSGTVNLSTAAAIVCAAEGITVAKHGNRAVSSQAGSADVLRALGIPTELSPEASSELLRRTQIAFLLAPIHHPAMRHVMPVRKELGVRTIFNCLGPLANPAGASHQLIGAFSDGLRSVLAETLKALGTERAWVVRGEDGLDEVSPYGRTRVTELSGGRLTEFTVTPDDFGLPTSAPGSAAGGDAEHNAKIIAQVLRGESHSASDAVVLNAAAALVVALELDPRQAAARARDSLESGRAAAKLQQWREAAQALVV